MEDQEIYLNSGPSFKECLLSLLLLSKSLITSHLSITHLLSFILLCSACCVIRKSNECVHIQSLYQLLSMSLTFFPSKCIYIRDLIKHFHNHYALSVQTVPLLLTQVACYQDLSSPFSYLSIQITQSLPIFYTKHVTPIKATLPLLPPLQLPPLSSNHHFFRHNSCYIHPLRLVFLLSLSRDHVI